MSSSHHHLSLQNQQLPALLTMIGCRALEVDYPSPSPKVLHHDGRRAPLAPIGPPTGLPPRNADRLLPEVNLDPMQSKLPDFPARESQVNQLFSIKRHSALVDAGVDPESKTGLLQKQDPTPRPLRSSSLAIQKGSTISHSFLNESTRILPGSQNNVDSSVPRGNFTKAYPSLIRRCMNVTCGRCISCKDTRVQLLVLRLDHNLPQELWVAPVARTLDQCLLNCIVEKEQQVEVEPSAELLVAAKSPAYWDVSHTEAHKPTDRQHSLLNSRQHKQSSQNYWQSLLPPKYPKSPSQVATQQLQFQRSPWMMDSAQDGHQFMSPLIYSPPPYHYSPTPIDPYISNYWPSQRMAESRA